MPAESPTKVIVQSSIEVDRWRVLAVTAISQSVPAIAVSFQRGLSNPDGTIEWQEAMSLSVEAAPYMVLMPDETKNWYDNLKSIAYQILKDEGEIPADVVVT